MYTSWFIEPSLSVGNEGCSQFYSIRNNVMMTILTQKSFSVTLMIFLGKMSQNRVNKPNSTEMSLKS